MFGSGEPVEDTAPTFSNKWDRVVYVLVQYRLPIFLTVAGLIIIATTEIGSIPSPPGWILDFTVPATILALPTGLVWRVVSKKVIAKISVEVIEYNGPMEDDRVYQVPPKTWKNREAGVMDAYQPPSGEVFKVSELEWMDDVGQLRVDGVWPSIADPNDVYKSQARFDRVFIDLLKELMKAQAFSATVAEKGVEIYDESTKEQIALIEDGILPDGVDAAEKIEELEDEIEDTLDIDTIGDMETEADEGRIDEHSDPFGPEQPGEAGSNPGGEGR